MDENRMQNSDFLTSFTRATNGMIATNDNAYSVNWNGSTKFTPTKTYSTEEVERIISEGSLEEKQRLSRTYFNKDGFYRRIIAHYATLLKYVGILIPCPSFGKSLSTSHIQKRYFSALDFIENAGLPVLLTNFAQRALVDGAYYGVIQSIDKNRISILDLPSGYCRTLFKDAFGNDLVEFNVSYFSTITNKDDRNAALAAYPPIVAKAYRKYRDGKTTNKWVMIPNDIGICFPFFGGGNVPMFLNVIPSTIHYDEAVETEREREKEEIRKILVQKIPHVNDGRLVFEPDEAEEMHKGAVGMLKGNTNISVLTTYADVDTVASAVTNESTSNNLEKMMQNIFYESGVSSQLFASNGSTTLESSLKNDLALMMSLANKFSLFLTNTINRIFANGNITFKYEIMPISYYNEDKYVDNSFKLAGSGYSFIMPALAMGITQRDLGNLKDLENDVLKLREKLLPLESSYTQSGSVNEGGAPKKEDEQKKETTIQKEKSLDNSSGGSV